MAKRILLVEDEEMIREMYHMALQKAGYEVESVEDGRDALTKLQQNPQSYNLVLLDIMLPGLDGISVLKEMKSPESAAKNIPVMLLTNLGLEDLIQEALELGALQYLVKSNTLPQQIIDQINAYFVEHG